MIGLYIENSNTLTQLEKLLASSNLEIYTPDHNYTAIIWLSKKKAPSGLKTITDKNLSLPMTLTEWQHLIQKNNVVECIYQSKKFLFNPNQRLLTISQTEQKINLTEKENALLAFLVTAPDHTASREILLQAVWQYNPQAQTHTLESHIYTLKQKLGTHADEVLKIGEKSVTLL